MVGLRSNRPVDHSAIRPQGLRPLLDMEGQLPVRLGGQGRAPGCLMDVGRGHIDDVSSVAITSKTAVDGATPIQRVAKAAVIIPLKSIELQELSDHARRDPILPEKFEGIRAASRLYQHEVALF